MKESKLIPGDVAQVATFFAQASAEVPSSVVGQAAAIALKLQDLGICERETIVDMGYKLVGNQSAISGLFKIAMAAHAAAGVEVLEDVLGRKIKGIIQGDFEMASELVELGPEDLAYIMRIAKENTRYIDVVERSQKEQELRLAARLRLSQVRRNA